MTTGLAEAEPRVSHCLLNITRFRHFNSLTVSLCVYSVGGLNKEQWLASLETFTGAFYKKFPDVELRGILIYLTQRFQEGEVSELGVLRSLIKTAGGYGFVDYDSTAALSDLQLDGRCGSRLLKRETSSFGIVDDINKKLSL